MRKLVSEEEKITKDCADCGFPVTKSLRAFNSPLKNADPGEVLCMSCSASRTVLVRKVAELPGTLAQIKSMRM